MFNSKTNLMKNGYYINLRRIIVETILSSVGAGFSVATITVFWNSIGMNQTDIGFVQMMFTIVIGFLDIPMGYLADRFNRKLLNIVGDIGVAFTFILYALSNNMIMAIISESLLGVFTAMTSGVDQSFLKSTCDKIDEKGMLFKKVNLKLHTARYVVILLVTIIGGFIAKYSIRLSIGVSFIPYFIGGIISFMIIDYGNKNEVKYRSPLKDLFYNIKKLIGDKKRRTFLFAYVTGREISHSQIWVFTPLLMLVGVPIEIVSIGWVLSYLMQIIGGVISSNMINVKLSNKYLIPFIIQMSWILVIVLNLNIVTVWLFALNGMVRGLYEGSLSTALQETADDKIQTCLMSLASTMSRLIYIPLVYIINLLGNINLIYALLGVFVIFMPLCIVTYFKLRKFD